MMRPNQFQPTQEGEARLLLLVAEFSQGRKVLEGRTKLAKLDFFLRYPQYLNRALHIRQKKNDLLVEIEAHPDIEGRMVRYRYGPWDPTYFAILGRLIGKGLIQSVPWQRGIGYKVTEQGRIIADHLKLEPAWKSLGERLVLLKHSFDLAGTTLKDFIYKNFPEITQARWGEIL